LDKASYCALFVSGGPGCGKSRFVQELPELLRQKAAEEVLRLPADFKHRLGLQRLFSPENLVQISSTITNGGDIILGEVKMDGRCIAAIRALYSAFCPSDVIYETLFLELRKLDAAELESLTVPKAVSIIARGRHLPELGVNQRPLFLTYVIDEAQQLVASSANRERETYV
jgi:hypothetical protein